MQEHRSLYADTYFESYSGTQGPLGGALKYIRAEFKNKRIDRANRILTRHHRYAAWKRWANVSTKLRAPEKVSRQEFKYLIKE